MVKSRESVLRLLILFIFLFLKQISGNFNLYVDKEEFHRITGGTLSQVYLVRDGVVNDYALGYVMTIPYHIQYLDFKWQATTKKPVHYEMVIEFSDFFALLQPSANISKVGRLPHKLESIRVSLPCSGRLTTEVPVIIRFTFHVKHTTKNNGQGHNVTEVNVKRNKICLLKENHNSHHPPPQVVPIDQSRPKEKHAKPSNPLIESKPGTTKFANSTLSNFYPPPPPLTTTPSLLLAGLLGACAVSASIASVLFFICLRKRLQKLDEDGQTGSTSSSDRGTSGEKYYHQHDPVVENSPACLLRNATNGRPGLWMEPKKDYIQPPPPLPNSYVNIASFWSDILEPKGTSGKETFAPQNNKSPNSKGSDVSPYAYAQIIHPPHLQQQPQWCQSFKSGKLGTPRTRSGSSSSTNAHIYANHLSSFTNQYGPNTNFSDATGKTGIYEGVDEVYDNYGGRSVGSGSLIQIDGFQCPKSFTKESQIVERFL